MQCIYILSDVFYPLMSAFEWKSEDNGKRETWESEKGTIGWKKVVTYQKQRLAVRATVFPFLIFWVHVNQGSGRILWKEVENWAHWKNVLMFTDPNFSSTRRAIWIILEKEMEEKEDEDDEEGKRQRKKKRRKTTPGGCPCVVLKPVQSGRAFRWG